jgi:L-ascorbate metabolism protein UlaG (beta-lactamase superfamily)
VTASIRWLGGATMELRLGSFRVLTDPVLASEPALDLDGLDALLLSHVREAHFDAAARARVPRTLWGLAPAEHVPQLERWGFDVIEGTIAGEEHHIERGGEILRLCVLPTRQSDDVAERASLGAANGYLIEHETVRRTLRIAWTGGAVWFDALPVAITARGLVDVLVPHLGGADHDATTTMDAAEVARLIAAVAPTVVMPVRHRAGSHHAGAIDALVARLADGPHHDALRYVEEGDVVRLD